MEKPRKKPGMAFWSAIAVVLALAYPLSFPPACRLILGREVPYELSQATFRFYRPLLSRAYQRKWPWKQYANLWGIDGNGLRSIVIVLDRRDELRQIEANEARRPK
jgi:hypothetical protein